MFSHSLFYWVTRDFNRLRESKRSRSLEGLNHLTGLNKPKTRYTWTKIKKTTTRDQRSEKWQRLKREWSSYSSRKMFLHYNNIFVPYNIDYITIIFSNQSLAIPSPEWPLTTGQRSGITTKNNMSTILTYAQLDRYFCHGKWLHSANQSLWTLYN